MGTQRIAVLVDGDNINAAHANEYWLEHAGWAALTWPVCMPD